MNMVLIIPFTLGLFGIFQGGLHRELIYSHGLATAALINSILLLAVALTIWLFAKYSPQSLPDIFKVKIFNFTNIC